MGRKAVNKVPAFVDALVAVGTRRLALLPGCSAEDAAVAMGEIADSLCNIYAKTVLYIPANLEMARLKRDSMIRAQYGQDGESGAGKYTAQRLHELAREYDMTPAHMYCIVRPHTGQGNAVPGAAAPAAPSFPLGEAWASARHDVPCTADDPA